MNPEWPEPPRDAWRSVQQNWPTVRPPPLPPPWGPGSTLPIPLIANGQPPPAQWGLHPFIAYPGGQPSMGLPSMPPSQSFPVNSINPIAALARASHDRSSAMIASWNMHPLPTTPLTAPTPATVQEPSTSSSTPLQVAHVGECVVCLEASSTHAIVPCGHQALCEKCALHYKPDGDRHDCPVCRGPVGGVFKIFVAAPIAQSTASSSQAAPAAACSQPLVEPGHEASQASATAPHEDGLAQHLIEMGFAPDASRDALEICGGNAEAAISMLLRQKEQQRAGACAADAFAADEVVDLETRADQFLEEYEQRTDERRAASLAVPGLPSPSRSSQRRGGSRSRRQLSRDRSRRRGSRSRRRRRSSRSRGRSQDRRYSRGRSRSRRRRHRSHD